MAEEGQKSEPVKILVADDVEITRFVLRDIIQEMGYQPMLAENGVQALGMAEQIRPQLIILDVSMPEIDGLEFCRMLKNDQATRDIPFIFITVLNTSKEKEEAFTAGAVDFIPKPFDNVEVLMRVSNHLNSYRLQQEMSDYNRMMHKLVEDQKNQIEKEHTNVLRALSRIVKKLDPEGGKHRSNVGYNCNLLAQGLQFSPAYEDEITDEFVEAIGVAARLHDIGRFLVQEENSDRESMEYIKKCAEEGSSVIEEFGADQEHRGALEMTRCIARYHHAHWDGSGYPQVQGRQIPLEARIAAVANDFDEMTAPKREGTALTPEEGQKRIKEMSGIYYDPDVVEVFDKLHSRMRTN